MIILIFNEPKGEDIVKLVGIDIGNNGIKIAEEIYRENESNGSLIVPNVVARVYGRQVLQDEESPLSALDVIINSSALELNNQRYYVGHLAMEQEDSQEIEETDNKALAEQSLIVAITSLAYYGIMNSMMDSVNYDQVETVEYYIGTGLPVRIFEKYHKIFEERLTGDHEVTFVTTPKLKNRKIRVIIRKVVVAVEGAAALFHLATDENLKVKDDKVASGLVGVCDIGSITTDLPIINKLVIDNQFSEGEQIGISTYLDMVMKDVEETYGYRFSSRSKLAHRIKNGEYNIQLLGEGQVSIKPIVDIYFSRAAMRMAELIKKRWKKSPDVQFFYVLGGGALALKPYLIEAAGPMKLRFVQDSELANMYGYLKIARSRYNQSRS
jgi:plasmid segregation protein ParM